LLLRPKYIFQLLKAWVNEINLYFTSAIINTFVKEKNFVFSSKLQKKFILQIIKD